MIEDPAQLVLDLAHRPALGAEDFLVSGSNRAAVEMIDLWPHWPHWAVVVSGPPLAGKTHLGNVWRLRADAACTPARAVSDRDVARLAECGALLVEDLDRGIGDERALFHLLNLAREHRHSILLTSALEPGMLEITLPDLRSRLRALPHIAIAAPDEALLKAILVKHFSDRQLAVEPQVVSYIATRMERSMASAARLAAEIDRLALATRRRVTRAVAAEVLAKTDHGEE